MVKQTSLSGIANRYVDLQLGPDGGEEIDDGGRIEPDHTAPRWSSTRCSTLFDEPHARARLQDFVQGQADSLRGPRRGAARAASTT